MLLRDRSRRLWMLDGSPQSLFAETNAYPFLPCMKIESRPSPPSPSHVTDSVVPLPPTVVADRASALHLLGSTGIEPLEHVRKSCPASSGLTCFNCLRLSGVLIGQLVPFDWDTL